MCFAKEFKMVYTIVEDSHKKCLHCPGKRPPLVIKMLLYMGLAVLGANIRISDKQHTPIRGPIVSLAPAVHISLYFLLP